MAEGGEYIPLLTNDQEDGDDDDIDYDSDQEDGDTQPFDRGPTSTPYPEGEQMEMHKLPREQSGRSDTSFDKSSIPRINPDEFKNETDKQERIEIVKDIIKKRFADVDNLKLGPIGFGKKKGNENTIVVFGSKGGESEERW